MSTAALQSCPRCESPLERGDLRCAICAQRAPASTDRAATSVTMLRCRGCGAALRYDPEAHAPRCAFCTAELEVETRIDPPEAVDRFVELTVDAARARRALREWLDGRGFFAPGDLVSEARLETLTPLWWVGWLFDVEALVSFTADSDAGSGRSRWAPHAGQVSLTYDDVIVSGSRGLTEAEARTLAPSYDVARVASEPTVLEAGAQPIVEAFDVQRSFARQRVVEEIHRIASGIVRDRHVPGSAKRNVHAVALLRRLETRRYAFPAYVLAYRYRDALYRVVISGHDPNVLTGNAPTSIAKVALVVAAGVAALLALLYGLAAAQ